MNIKADILGLKHRFEMKQGNLHYNSDISRGSSVNHVTLNRFLKSTIKIVSLSVLTRFARHFRSQGLNIELGSFFRWEGNDLVSNIGPLIRRLDPIPTDEQIAQETQIPLLRTLKGIIM